MDSDVVDVSAKLKRMHVIEKCIPDGRGQRPARLRASNEFLNVRGSLLDTFGGCWKAHQRLKTRGRSTTCGQDSGEDLTKGTVNRKVD